MTRRHKKFSTKIMSHSKTTNQKKAMTGVPTTSWETVESVFKTGTYNPDQEQTPGL